MIVPGSGLVKAQAEAEGLDKIFMDAGFEWREPGCSMCLGMNPDQLKPGERCASTSNRNFEGRQGQAGRTHLVSPQWPPPPRIAGRFVDIREHSTRHSNTPPPGSRACLGRRARPVRDRAGETAKGVPTWERERALRSKPTCRTSSSCRVPPSCRRNSRPNLPLPLCAVDCPSSCRPYLFQLLLRPSVVQLVVGEPYCRTNPSRDRRRSNSCTSRSSRAAALTGRDGPSRPCLCDVRARERPASFVVYMPKFSVRVAPCGNMREARRQSLRVAAEPY